ncbi:MAG: hypothetical protein A2283_07835 [Lentisphaerae bacterium RIFOXYA12_FULL_48_11]|nr:MAG: hypothetical protein A2283_07835 [Lentisphaerae bacterium RIFOXYA12_FULL_48_11]
MKYDIKQMTVDLLERVDQFIAGSLTQADLKTYAQDQFWKWDNVDDATLPPPNDNDRVYWAAIHDIWNLNDQPPEYHPGIEEIKMHRRYLTGEKQLPVDELANRPTRKIKEIAEPSSACDSKPCGFRSHER